MDSLLRVWGVATVLGLLVAGSGCTPGEEECTDWSCDDGGGGDTGRRTDGAERPDTATGDLGDGAASEVTSLVIDPADFTLECLNGATPTLRYAVSGLRRDGTRRPLAGGTWSLDATRLGEIAGDGTFTPNGLAGGTVTVRVEANVGSAGTLRASATLTVRITTTAAEGGSLDAASPHFAGVPATDPMRAPALLYPLDRALMPNNVAPPHVMWSPAGAAGDWFRVQIAKPHVLVTTYVLHTGAMFRHDWTVAAPAWRAIAESDPDAPAVFTLTRWDLAANAAFQGAPVQVTLTPQGIYGSIYYWDLGDGRTQRINASTGRRDAFMPNPPVRASDGRRCVACHTISRDGRYLSAELWDGGDFSTVFDLTADLSVDPAPTVFPTNTLRYLYSAFNPDGTRLVTNAGNGFGMIDPRAGMSVAATGLPTAGAAHPEWSPDGNDIAYIANVNGGWAVDFTSGDLALLPRTMGDAFGAPRVLHRGADLAGRPEGGMADSHPTWSPDARFLAFAHGTHSRSLTRNPDESAVPQPGALYLAARDGSAVVRLDHANGGPMGRDSYWPTYSPFTTRGAGEVTTWHWLAFYSLRDYGNAVAGTRGRRQLWVSAIRTDGGGGADPSSVPYWMPGQDPATDNMAAWWAAQPCRGNGAECRTSSECCSGRCNAMGRCEPPPPEMCRREGATCGATGDCCMGLVCVGNTCSLPPPGR